MALFEIKNASCIANILATSWKPEHSGGSLVEISEIFATQDAFYFETGSFDDVKTVC